MRGRVVRRFIIIMNIIIVVITLFIHFFMGPCRLLANVRFLEIVTRLRGFRSKIAFFFFSRTPLSRNSQKRLEHKQKARAAEPPLV